MEPQVMEVHVPADVTTVTEALRASSKPSLVLVFSGVASERLNGLRAQLLAASRALLPDAQGAHYEQFRSNLGLKDTRKTQALYLRLSQVKLIDLWRARQLSRRAYNGIEKLGEPWPRGGGARYGRESIVSLADLARYTREDLFGVKYIGLLSVQEIIDLLQSYRVTLPEK